MVMDKRGFLRIVEAVFAILIVIGFLFVLSINKVQKSESKLGEDIPALLDEIAKNDEMREKIVSYDDVEPGEQEQRINEIESFLRERVKEGVSVSVRICEPDEPCPIGEGLVGDDKEVFSGERIISSSRSRVNNYNPMRVKIFLWR